MYSIFNYLTTIGPYSKLYNLQQLIFLSVHFLIAVITVNFFLFMSLYKSLKLRIK